MDSKEHNSGAMKVNIHHLYYVLLIAVLIIVVLILHIPFGISRYAFDNFSFASTITSIVLAVVSIVYSIQSGNSSSDQLNGVRDIERNITKQLNNFSELEDKLHKKVDEIKSGVATVKEGQADIKETFSHLVAKEALASPDKSDSKSDYLARNSLLGNFVLYSCALAFRTKRPLPGVILSKQSDDYNYCYGYLIALCVFKADKIAVDVVDGSLLNSVVTHYDEKAFGTKEQLIAKIKSDLTSKDNMDGLKSLLNEINEYFDKSKNEEVRQ